MDYLNILIDSKKRFLIQVIWRTAFFIVINLCNFWQVFDNPVLLGLFLVALFTSGALLWEGIYFYYAYANFKHAITSYRHIYDHVKGHTSEKRADALLKEIIQHTLTKYEKYNEIQRSFVTDQSFVYEKLLKLQEVLSQEKDNYPLKGMLGEDSKLDKDDLFLLKVNKSFAERLLYEKFNSRMLGFNGKRYFHKINYEIKKISYDNGDKIINTKK
ncbi:hypothetical protein LSG23_20275 (plasmid) [Bacillus velezensis]|uniref:hypothetical protein n=1 Tax=Bacillus velezensis TaxID=492670 RepID=UPI000987FFAA|nr:hypothetical protein [Bacillus velezensis]AQS42455.1 hypothetical protein BVH55_00215 [Bacillus velezensis]WNR83257.1 hypothetical protein RP314_20575 [Bacillus velezensis]